MTCRPHPTVLSAKAGISRVARLRLSKDVDTDIRRQDGVGRAMSQQFGPLV